MLKQHIQIRVTTTHRRREQNISVSVPQRVVDERSVLTHQSIQVQMPDQLGRHHRPQLRPACSGSPNTDRNNASCGCPPDNPSPPPVMAHTVLTGSDITHEAVSAVSQSPL